MAFEMCPECFKQISSSAKSCPYCGYTKQTVAHGKENSNVLKIGLSILGVFIFIIFIISWRGCNAWININNNTDGKEISKKHQKSNLRMDGSLIYEEWYKGGILHKASVKYWKAATYENKLATCADFIYVVDRTISKDLLKKKARKLVRQINREVKKPEITDETKVIDIAKKYLGEFEYKEAFVEGITKQDALKRNNSKILDIETFGIAKKVIYIQIPEQLTKQQLEDIAIQLRNENIKYDRLFIFYLLPNMEIGSGAWATTHYNNDLTIKILGVDKSTEERIKNTGFSTGELIGKWYDKTPIIEHSIIISKVDGKYKLKRAFRDGSVMEKNLHFSVYNGKSKFVYESDVGEYLLIEKNGQLGQYDDYGLISTCEKIK